LPKSLSARSPLSLLCDVFLTPRLPSELVEVLSNKRWAAGVRSFAARRGVQVGGAIEDPLTPFVLGVRTGAPESNAAFARSD